MTNVKTQPKKIADYFRGSKARRDFFAQHELNAYDCDQLLQMERGFASVGLGGSRDGLPSTSVLLAVWKKARDSFERVMKALPAGELKDAMALELQIRDAAMGRLQEEAKDQLYAKLVKDEAEVEMARDG